MQRFILNLNHLSIDLIENNTSYFYKNNLFRINSSYYLIMSPYDVNSSHKFRDIYKTDDFYMLLIMNIILNLYQVRNIM